MVKFWTDQNVVAKFVLILVFSSLYDIDYILLVRATLFYVSIYFVIGEYSTL